MCGTAHFGQARRSMCGIAGFFGAVDDARADLMQKSMLAAVRYRGRDDEGSWRSVSAGLVHTRLSVIDLATGHQPMQDVEGRYTIVFNGEIYNYPELREEYEKSGVGFRTSSDTEVILAGYRLKGEHVCSDLNGMFAFAIHDRNTDELFLARDRLGKKPLFWCRIGGTFCFAATLDAFRGLPGWRDDLDQDALAFFCASGFFRGDETIYSGARALLPGCSMRLSAREPVPVVNRYWQLRMPRAKAGNSLAELTHEYETLLTDALRIRLRSDVPLALTFSGGVDSGTLAALCASRLNLHPHCYTIDYHTERDPSEETLTARHVAEHLGLPWTHIQFDYHQDLLADLDEAYADFDQPCTQIALVYSRRLYATIKPYATVVLSGNGADELFTGYVGDERQAQAGALLDLIRPLRRAAQHLRLPALLSEPVPRLFARRLQARSCASGAWTEAVGYGASKLAEEALDCGAESALDFKMFLSLRYSGVDSNFRLPDISGLGAQVEVRSPFLDYRMVEFAARLPHRWKVGSLWFRPRTKYLPKSYYARHVGSKVAWGPKRGMAWNVQYGMSAAQDPKYRAAFQAAYDVVDQYGLPAAQYRTALDAHTKYMLQKGPPSPYGGTVMTGFMLGRWLSLKHPT
jgi:asparagine synthase (glutamine-hydrolysing)